MIISCDFSEKYFSLTEFYALQKAFMYLPEYQHIIYVGFPWSNLFNAIESQKPHQHFLVKHLEKIKEKIPLAYRIVTVCEHVNLLAHIPLVKEIGVTDIFWSHAKKTDSLSLNHEISIHPFAIYPEEKKDIILKSGNFGWCINDDGFDLEPLWQCIDQEIIPIISESLKILPGNGDLWSEATVQCNRKGLTPSEKVLQEINGDDHKISVKKLSLRQLRLCYGKDFFITDIVRFFFNPSNRINHNHNHQENNKLPNTIIGSGSPIYFSSFISNLMFDPKTMRGYFFSNYFLQKKLLREFNNLNSDKKNIYRKTLAHYGIDIG